MTRVLVLGAYGLIGSAVSRRLREDGFQATALGRDERTAYRVLPSFDWIIRDLADLREPDKWTPLLDRIGVVVNCAGALQQGAKDDLDTVHHGAIEALAQACETQGIGLVQISAVGAHKGAPTAFMRTKAKGDDAVRRCESPWWIFRPGLVLAPTAYGGTALLRMLAATPLVQPLALPEARIQTVSVNDVAEAVSLAIRGQVQPGTECDLVEDEAHSLRDVLAAQRQWLGFGPARREVVMPRWTLTATTAIADALGRLGWRSPLRSTAIRSLSDGVLGDPQSWHAAGGSPLTSMHETLATMPASVEDRLFARIALLMPLVIATLFVFWLASGLIGLARIDAAVRVLEDAGWPHRLASASVVFWALVDIAIASALLVRRTAKAACWAMVIVSLIYLVAATVFTPALWADPLGPLVKILPAIALALVARAILETR